MKLQLCNTTKSQVCDFWTLPSIKFRFGIGSAEPGPNETVASLAITLTFRSIQEIIQLYIWINLNLYLAGKNIKIHHSDLSANGACSICFQQVTKLQNYECWLCNKQPIAVAEFIEKLSGCQDSKNL